MEEAMYRKILLVLAAILSVAMAAPSTASARGFRGGGFRGGRGFGFAAPAIGLGLGLGLGAGYYGGYYGGPYASYGYGYGGRGCWRRVVVDTPYGPRARRIWVC
jgi:hypothetical protein